MSGGRDHLWVGLTGGIGSGKSTVARELGGLGAAVIDADRLARDVLAPGTDGLAEVAQRFGPDVISDDGSLDRSALGRIVFDDPQARADLEAITHPRIRELTRRAREACASAVVVHDIPLLVEAGRADDYDVVIVVGASEELRLQRVLKARDVTEEQVRKRMAAQADDEARAAVADIWIDNDGTPEQLTSQVLRVWEQLKDLADRGRR